MPSPEGISHSQSIIWVVGFFFVGIGSYGTFFWYLVKGLKKTVFDLQEGLQKIDKKKVEMIVYMDDKEEAKKIIAHLQTIDRCLLMQRACVGGITPIMEDMREDLRAVLKNQEELSGVKEVMQLVTDRQKEVIGRIDSHLNGHSHKE